MAKLNDLIEGYDAMTAEERTAAIEALEIPDAPDMSKFVKKELFDKTASELAAAKKAIAENMSAEEAAKAAKEEADAERDALIKELTRKNEIAESEKELLKQGYNPVIATELAEAMADGDKAKQFELMAKHDAEREKALRAEITRKNPKPAGGSPDNDENKYVAYAKEYGEKIAGKRKSANDILSKYTNNN